jgi:hypothetical protein
MHHFKSHTSYKLTSTKETNKQTQTQADIQTNIDADIERSTFMLARIHAHIGFYIANIQKAAI